MLSKAFQCGSGIFLYLLLSLSSFCTAQDAIDLTVEDFEAPSAGAFSVPLDIKLNGNPDIKDLTIGLSFQPEILSFQGVSLAYSPSGIAPSQAIVEYYSPPDKEGTLRIGLASDFAVQQNGRLLFLSFEMIQCPSPEMNESTMIAFTEATSGEGAVSIDTQDGTITFPECFPTFFIRGDANADSFVDLSDAVFILHHIFVDDQNATCGKALDANDDGDINIADPVFVLTYLFNDGLQPYAPFPACGRDLTADDLTCDSFLPCEED